MNFLLLSYPLFNKHVLNCLFAFLFYPLFGCSRVLFFVFSVLFSNLSFSLSVCAHVSKETCPRSLKKKKHVDATAFQKQSKKRGSTPAR